MKRCLAIAAAFVLLLAACATTASEPADSVSRADYEVRRRYRDQVLRRLRENVRDANPIETPAGGLIPLGVNAQGYFEYKRGKDGGVMVLVPAGAFPKHQYTPDPLDDRQSYMVDVPAFLIDKYEVTNQQVAEFLAVTMKDWTANAVEIRFKEHIWIQSHLWGIHTGEGLGASVPSPHPQTGCDNYPAVGTSGHLAIAFAKWIGGDLPYYYEWEKAAAGPSGLLFPWGDAMPDSTRCNGFLWGPRRTMPVGSYPAGVSPYGCHDMAGNVYERVYPYQTPADVDGKREPTSIKGASWLSPSWINFRNLDHCGQSVDACEGSVGFRCVIRDPAVLAALGHGPKPALRVLDDVEAAFAEASKRNVPIFLFLGFETCGSCDRVRAEVFTDPRFFEFCNEYMVVLAGHHPGDGAGFPLQSGPEGASLLIPGCKTEKLQQVFDYFCLAVDVGVVPGEVTSFGMSPGMFVLNPHRDLMEKPEQLLLVRERELPKGGVGVEKFIERFKAARKALGQGQTRGEYLAGKPAPKTSWKPTEK